jgi:hypothetical protein
MRDPIDAAFVEGASRAQWNAAKRIAKQFNILPAIVRGLTPTENLVRVVRAAENKLKDAQELLDMRAKALRAEGEHVRFPRFRDRAA